MKINYRVWLSTDSDDKIFGYGIYQLLRYVRLFGSMSKACTAMNIPYAKASMIVKRCEKYFDEEIVIRHAGGINGGGSEISEFGLELMDRYQVFIEETDLKIRELYSKHLECFDDL